MFFAVGFVMNAQDANLAEVTETKAKCASIEQCALKLGKTIEECKKMCAENKICKAKTADANTSSETKVASMSLAKNMDGVITDEPSAKALCSKRCSKKCAKKCTGKKKAEQ